MAALQKFFSAVVWSQVLELGTNRSDFPKNGFYYAFHAENASKDITFIGATFKASYYKGITHLFITEAQQYLLVSVIHFTHL